MSWCIWCILIPLLFGLLCAWLGYKYGKDNSLEEKVSQLEEDLEACNKSKLNLQAKGEDLNIWRDKVSTLEASLATTANKNSLALKAQEEDTNTWKSKVAKLEADLKLAKESSDAKAADLSSWKSKLSLLETNLADANKSNLALQAQGSDLNEWKNKVTKLETDLKLANDNNALKSKDLDIWKNKVANLKTDLENCNKNKLSLEADLKAAKTPPVVLLPFNGDAAKAVFGKKIKQDDLKIVEGIGPKIEGLFNNFNIKTWKELSETSIEKCQEVLDSGGDRYKIHNPGTWPKQAALAYEGKWAELLKWQDELDGGKA